MKIKLILKHRQPGSKGQVFRCSDGQITIIFKVILAMKGGYYYEGVNFN